MTHAGRPKLRSADHESIARRADCCVRPLTRPDPMNQTRLQSSLPACSMIYWLGAFLGSVQLGTGKLDHLRPLRDELAPSITSSARYSPNETLWNIDLWPSVDFGAGELDNLGPLLGI